MTEELVSTAKPLISSKLYDLGKKAATIGLPAAGTFYFALASIWGLPGAEEVIGTIAAANAFLGVFLHVSTVKYNNSDAKFDGSVTTAPGEGGNSKVLFSLDPADLITKKEITLKVTQ